MAKIKIENLPVNTKIDKEEMKKVMGGLLYNFSGASPISQQTYWSASSQGMYVPQHPGLVRSYSPLTTTYEGGSTAEASDFKKKAG